MKQEVDLTNECINPGRNKRTPLSLIVYSHSLKYSEHMRENLDQFIWCKIYGTRLKERSTHYFYQVSAWNSHRIIKHYYGHKYSRKRKLKKKTSVNNGYLFQHSTV